MPAHQKRIGDEKIEGFAPWIVGTSTLFPGFGSFGLPSFLNFKIILNDHHFWSNEKVIANINSYFSGLLKEHYKNGIFATEHH